MTTAQYLCSILWSFSYHLGRHKTGRPPRGGARCVDALRGGPGLNPSQRFLCTKRYTRIYTEWFYCYVKRIPESKRQSLRILYRLFSYIRLISDMKIMPKRYLSFNSLRLFTSSMLNFVPHRLVLLRCQIIAFLFNLLQLLGSISRALILVEFEAWRLHL